MSCEEERQAVKECVERLWMLHSGKPQQLQHGITIHYHIYYVYVSKPKSIDYFGHLFVRAEEGVYMPHVLQYHTNMFSGIRSKFAGRGSNREAVWSRLRAIPPDHFRLFTER